MLVAGWHAHTLNAPGKFLLSAPEHDTPRRARAYLLTDQAIASAATSYAALRPLLDEMSTRALEERAQTLPDEPGSPAFPAYAGSKAGSPESDRESPGALLWLALCIAPSEGASIADLMSASNMNRTTLYRHLTDHLRAGRAIQVSRGHWRAATTGDTDATR